MAVPPLIWFLELYVVLVAGVHAIYALMRKPHNPPDPMYVALSMNNRNLEVLMQVAALGSSVLLGFGLLQQALGNTIPLTPLM